VVPFLNFFSAAIIVYAIVTRGGRLVAVALTRFMNR
jgi:hypothetical protein